MNRNERDRVTIMAWVKQRALTLVAAAGLLGLGYRQAKRVWQRYQTQGDAGLVHRSRGRPSPQRTAPEVRERVLRRCAERYPDFGPTLAAEYLRKEGLGVDHETLRRWQIAAGVRPVRRRRQRHRQWRERKTCFGAMVQLDGSHHDWFEGRRAKCVLMVMVDDATNRVWARFFEAETTQASYDVFEGGCGGIGCRAVCMWIGTAFTGAKGWGAWPTHWRGKRRRRSLDGPWTGWG